MAQYSDIVMDHFSAPRNPGVLPGHTGAGHVRFQGRGPSVSFYVRCDQERVVAASFESLGCGATVAACSLLTGLVEGRLVRDCRAFARRRERHGGATSYDVTHSWDEVGNRLVKIDSGVRTTASYDAANQIQKQDSPSGRVTYLHDAAGNRTRRACISLGYAYAFCFGSRPRF